MNLMSQVFPHLALSLSYLYLSFSPSIYISFCSGKITFKVSDNPASSTSSLQMKTAHPLLLLYPLSVVEAFLCKLLQSSPIFSNETKTLSVFYFPKSPLSASMAVLSPKSPWISLAPFLRSSEDNHS